MINTKTRFYQVFSYTITLLILLGALLQSFYSSTFQMSVFPVVSIILVFCLTILYSSKDELRIMPFELNNLYYVVFAAIVFASLLQIQNTDIKTLGGILLSTTCSYCLVKFYLNRNEIFFNSIKYLLILSIAFWYFQCFYYFNTGQFIDFLEIYGFGQSSFGSTKGAIYLGQRVPRFTGLFNEPGSYCTYIFPLIALHYLYIKKFGILIFLSLVSMVLSLSFFGLLLVVGFLILVLANNSKLKMKILSVLCSTSIVLIFNYFAYDSVISRFQSTSSGIDLRSDMLNLLSDSNITELLIGNGTDPSNFPPWIVLNDFGLWYAAIYCYGVFGLLLIIATYIPFLTRRNYSFCYLLSLVYLTKIKLQYPFFWYFWAGLLLLEIHRDELSTIQKR